MSRSYGWKKNVDDYNQTRVVAGTGAFGDLVTAGLTPKAQVMFNYGGHVDMLYEYTLLTGSVSYANSLCTISTGATLYGTAYIRTTRVLRYRPGQGARARFTAIFDTPTEGVSQTAGLYGGSENGIFVGYNYLDSQQRFGVCRQYNGVRAVHTLTMTVAAIGAETFDVELNGVTTSVTLSAGTLAENAQEVAATAFSGWVAEANGPEVHFLAENVGARGGAYSVTNAGSADGTFNEDTAGVAVTEDWVYQESWNEDKFDGTGPSGIEIDPTKGNVYEITFQYLGFGTIELHIEDPDTGRYCVAHRYRYANGATQPSVSNPIFAVGAAVSNVSVGADTSVSVGSLAGFVEGKSVITGPDHGASATGSIGATTTIPVLSLRCNEVFVDGVAKVNLRDMFPLLASMSASGSNREFVVELYKNSTLTDPLWVNYDSTHSFASVDTSATASSGGDLINARGLANAADAEVNLSDLGIDMRPGDTITIVLTTTGNAGTYVAAIGWKEDA